MDFKDYYKILGVEKTASADDIRTAYRRLARKYHPDVSKEPDAQARMQDLNEARDVLSDPEKRSAYDQLASHPHGAQDFRPPPDWNTGYEFSGSGAQDGDYSDFFTNLFGRGAPRGQPRGRHVQGEDRHARIQIDLADSYQGATRTITLQQPAIDAQGQVTRQEHTLDVRIPKGIREGQHIRLRGKGGAGMGDGPAGDLYLEVQFRPDVRYRVEGADVYSALPVAPWEAALGASITATTPAGTFDVQVPSGSQNARKLRLRGRGLPGEPAGDFYLVLEVVLPPADSDKARQLYETMAREMPFNPRQRQGA
ncbi:DnaJ C-terminal domain-containing protein [Bordetella sp. FB-8]|uniref:DnaJ C-terminal domain-containing protein n=1 Tax=Bordetella sp. FB-8 TaxID=1159870 RepID=UPI0003743C2F|nr:DnaJ C-terminal domain-containing protein [Bordetella sp. FB-8]